MVEYGFCADGHRFVRLRMVRSGLSPRCTWSRGPRLAQNLYYKERSEEIYQFEVFIIPWFEVSRAWPDIYRGQGEIAVGASNERDGPVGGA